MTDESPLPTSTTPAWWGALVFAEDGARYVRVGPFELWLERRHGEWTVHTRAGTDPRDAVLMIDRDADDDDVPDVPENGAPAQSLALHPEANTVLLRPRLADRAVVFSPSRTLIVPARGRATLYATSPLWIEVATHDGGRLFEAPLWRASDTWFGDTADGELCYASRLHATRDPGELLRLPHRAVTPLDIANGTDEPLTIERISVPLRSLTLFRDAEGQLWTESVRLEPDRGAGLADVTRSGAAPAQARGAEKIAEPRDLHGLHFTARVFRGLFGGDDGR